MKKLTLEQIQERIVRYQIIVMLSFLFGVLGFVYNNWRYEHNEYNNNVRVASFQMIQELASLEQNIYANHYDHNDDKGNPRDGWVKVGLIDELALFISPECEAATEVLKNSWQKNWNRIERDSNATNTLVKNIEQVRETTRSILIQLH